MELLTAPVGRRSDRAKEALSLLTPATIGPPLTFTIPTSPNNCFNPDCEFQITVDSTLVVPESNEGNNVAKGVCPG